MADIDLIDYLERDWYQIHDNYGEKYIHIFGYAYHGEDNGDGEYRIVEYCGFEMPLEDFIKGIHSDEDWYCNEECQTKQYIGDYTKEGVIEYIIASDIPEFPELGYGELTMETECGDYID